MFRQVTFFGSENTGKPDDPADVPIKHRQELHDQFQAGLIEWNDGSPLKLNLNQYFVPLFMHTNTKQVSQLKAIQSALNKAVVHVVENWWTDKEANYPKRMPIETHQEKLLKVSLSCLALD